MGSKVYKNMSAEAPQLYPALDEATQQAFAVEQAAAQSAVNEFHATQGTTPLAEGEWSTTSYHGAELAAAPLVTSETERVQLASTTNANGHRDKWIVHGTKQVADREYTTLYRPDVLSGEPTAEISMTVDSQELAERKARQAALRAASKLAMDGAGVEANALPSRPDVPVQPAFVPDPQEYNSPRAQVVRNAQAPTPVKKSWFNK